MDILKKTAALLLALRLPATALAGAVLLLLAPAAAASAALLLLLLLLLALLVAPPAAVLRTAASLVRLPLRLGLVLLSSEGGDDLLEKSECHCRANKCCGVV